MVDQASEPGYFLHNARIIVNDGWSHTEEQVNAIEESIVERPSFAFDLAKTLVESVCKTILTERGVPHKSDDDLPQLFRMVTQQLPFLPPSASGEAEARNSLQRTLGGLHTTLLALCELRNTYGFSAHGTDRQRPSLESTQAMLAAQAADTIIGFLYGAHRLDRIFVSQTKLEYGDYPQINEFVDEVHGPVRIFGLEYKPSEVLFQLDPEAYNSLIQENQVELSQDEDNSTEQVEDEVNE